jgi:glycine cleavage system H protein
VSDIPQDLLYTEDHEYLKPAGEPEVVFIGITDYAQGELGDIVFIELPKVGATFKKHDVFGTIEAVKAVSELYAPVSGEVLEVNGRLDGEPALVNTSPYGHGTIRPARRRCVHVESRLSSRQRKTGPSTWTAPRCIRKSTAVSSLAGYPSRYSASLCSGRAPMSPSRRSTNRRHSFLCRWRLRRPRSMGTAWFP